MKRALLIILLLPFIILIKLISPNRAASRRKIERVIKRKYPEYKINDIKMQYTDWSSSVKEAGACRKATLAVAEIANDEEQRTLHFELLFGIWRITHDAPDSGRNVPEDEYFSEVKAQTIDIGSDIDRIIENVWIIPEKNGDLYCKIDGKYQCYSYRYLENMYMTKNENVYELNKKTFQWELSELTYSSLDYLGNYERISKAEAEEFINRFKEHAAAQD